MEQPIVLGLAATESTLRDFHFEGFKSGQFGMIGKAGCDDPTCWRRLAALCDPSSRALSSYEAKSGFALVALGVVFDPIELPGIPDRALILRLRRLRSERQATLCFRMSAARTAGTRNRCDRLLFNFSEIRAKKFGCDRL